MAARITGPRLEQVVIGRRVLQDGSGRRLREEAGLSRATIASRIPCHQATLAKWETGQRVPRPATAARYAKVLAELLEVVDLVES